ncbi:hypothetical protein ACFQKF_19840 [Halalkalicoccus sp. GCM10025322]|uniref:hypothetical protein n=1 Tax=Halalkalicoccus TaxID=332246 RepID=UPI002F969803
MPEPQYEYDVEPFSLAPSELENAKLAFTNVLNDRASNGWVLDETLRIDAASFFLIFRRPIDE